jgi:hypothetical protein
MKLPFEKSFASHQKAEFWSVKNKEKPDEVFMKSGKKFWFDCNKCNHSFEVSLDSIVLRSTWCKYCYNDICTNKDCKYCFKKSFASHEKAQYWSSKNELNPRDVTLNNNKIFIFNCNKCNHEFSAELNNRRLRFDFEIDEKNINRSRWTTTF